LFLQRLNLTILKLGDFPTVSANHVIVVALAGGMLEEGASLAKLSLVGQPGLLQEFQRPIDRDQANPRVPAAHPTVEGLGANVGVGGKKGSGDQFALAGALEPGLDQVLLKLPELMPHCEQG